MKRSPYERCVLKLKKSAVRNPFAVCAKRLGRFGGKPAGYVVVPTGERRVVYETRRGRKFYLYGKKKLYLTC